MSDSDSFNSTGNSSAQGILTRAASFTSSMARFAAGGFRTVSHQTYQDRFAHCLTCPHYDLGLCQVCGCWLDAKVRLPHEACPEGKWLAEEQAG
jgi:hypothetical protein